jgi:hypothetical protein
MIALKKGLFSKKKVTSIVTKNRLELGSKHLYPFWEMWGNIQQRRI